MPKVTLCMIVKNEAHVIERCLASTMPVIDNWVIVDTGSTDGTQEKIKDFFKRVGIEGKLYERPWVNFGHNRSELLELARPEGDYNLMIDADEILEFNHDFNPESFKEGLTADLYDVFAHAGPVEYFRPQLTSSRLKFYYSGVCHEYVDCHDEIKTRAKAEGFINRPIQDGARSKDPEKYLKDAKLFEDEFAKGTVAEKDVNRYHFYMAQCYRDARSYKKAIECYSKRASLGGWNEEVFWSLFEVGKLKEALNAEAKSIVYPIDEIIKHYVDAHAASPIRAESLFYAGRLCSQYGRLDQAYRFYRIASKLAFPKGALFTVPFIYDWAISFEMAQVTHLLENYHECKVTCERLLREGKLPIDLKPKVEEKLNHTVHGWLQSK